MKVKIIKPFRDIHTKESYKANSVVDVTKRRYNEMIENLGYEYVAEVEDIEEG